jgi:hypothetical protein
VKLLKEKLWQQTAIGIITVVSFPFLYNGAIDANKGLLLIGYLFLFSGMIAAPLITYLHRWNNN